MFVLFLILEKQFSLSPLSSVLAMSFSLMPLEKLRELSSIPGLLSGIGVFQILFLQLLRQS